MNASHGPYRALIIFYMEASFSVCIQPFSLPFQLFGIGEEIVQLCGVSLVELSTICLYLCNLMLMMSPVIYDCPIC